MALSGGLLTALSEVFAWLSAGLPTEAIVGWRFVLIDKRQMVPVNSSSLAARTHRVAHPLQAIFQNLAVDGQAATLQEQDLHTRCAGAMQREDETPADWVQLCPQKERYSKNFYIWCSAEIFNLGYTLLRFLLPSVSIGYCKSFKVNFLANLVVAMFELQ